MYREKVNLNASPAYIMSILNYLQDIPTIKNNYVRMKPGKTYTVADLLKGIFKDKRFEDGLLSAQIKREWPEVVGVKVASATGNMWVKNGVLFVEIRSSIIRSELKMISKELVSSINRRLGEEAISDMIVR